MKILGYVIVFLCFTTNICKAQTDTIEMHLLGAHCLKVCKGSVYTDSGCAYHDSISTGDLTVTSEGDFHGEGTKKKGVYKLRYKAVDRNGNIGYSEWRIIQVVDSNELPGCRPVAVDCNKIDTMQVSIKENKLPNKINIYPNPAQNELFIETNQLINAISIYNISGQKWQEININQNLNHSYKIDTKHFPAGIYMVQLKNASGIITRKIEIRR